MVKHLPTMWETRVQFLGWEDLLEKEMVTHSSILAWKIPWTEEPGRQQSMGLQSRTWLSDFTFTFKTLPGPLTEQRTEQSQPAADRPIPCWRQAGEGSQSQKGAITAPERHHLPNCKQASLLTKTSWDSGWLTSAWRVAARDQLPKRDTWHAWEGTLVVHPENRVAGMGEVIRHSPQLGETALTKHLITWGAQTWDGHKTQAQPSVPLCGVPENLNLSGVDLGSTCNPGAHLRRFLAEQPRA